MYLSKLPLMDVSLLIPNTPLRNGSATLSYAITESMATILEANCLRGDCKAGSLH
jgi:hypothetical protein